MSVFNDRECQFSVIAHNIRPWTSERERHAGYDAFIHFNNQHRSHGRLGWATPTATLATLKDNVLAEHT